MGYLLLAPPLPHQIWCCRFPSCQWFCKGLTLQGLGSFAMLKVTSEFFLIFLIFQRYQPFRGKDFVPACEDRAWVRAAPYSIQYRLF